MCSIALIRLTSVSKMNPCCPDFLKIFLKSSMNFNLLFKLSSNKIKNQSKKKQKHNNLFSRD